MTFLSSLLGSWAFFCRHGQVKGSRPARSSGKASVQLAVERLEERRVLAALVNPALVPAPGDPTWKAKEKRLASEPRGDPLVVFLGDSILARFAHGPGTRVWAAEMAPLDAADYAIGGSQTQNLLWEIDAGQLNGTAPRVVVLLIGTNNLDALQRPAEVAGGIGACVAAIEAREPQARILLLGILPREPDPHAPIRKAILQTNAVISGFAADPRVAYLDVGRAFVRRDGTLRPGVLHHSLHPTTRGYEVLAAAIRPALLWLLLTGG